MKKSILRALCLVLMLSMLLTACGGGATSSAAAPEAAAPAATEAAAQAAEPATEAGQEPVTLRIYIRYSDDDTILPYDNMVKELAEEMPWVTLDLDPMAADDDVKLKSYAATGDMPDIFNISGLDVLDTLKASGNVAELSALVKANGFVDEVLPSSYSKLYYPGTEEIYTLPYTGSEVVLLYINQQMFNDNGVKIPETIEELVTAASTFSGLGIAPISIFAKEKWICFAFCDMIATRYIPGGFTALEDGTATIDDPRYLQAAQDVLDLAAAGMFPTGSTNVNYEQATELWYNDRSAMFINGQWEIPTTTERMGDKAIWVPAPAASADTIETTRYDFNGGYGVPAGLAVSPNSENFEAAVETASFIARSYAEFIYNERGVVTIALDVPKHRTGELSPMMAQLDEYAAKITSVSQLGDLSDTELNVVVQDECQRLIAGNTTADEFIANIKRITG